MCHISKLGKYLFLRIASEWLVVVDMVSLDSAICCSTYRPIFLNYFETTQIVFSDVRDTKTSQLCFMWQLKRKILMDKLSVDFHDFAWFDSVLLFYGFWKSRDLLSVGMTQFSTGLQTFLSQLRFKNNDFPSFSNRRKMYFQNISNLSSPKVSFGKGCKHLSRLKLFNCVSIGDAELNSIAIHCSNLTTLHLVLCPRITNKGLVAVSSSVDCQVSDLMMSDCVQVTTDHSHVVLKWDTTESWKMCLWEVSLHEGVMTNGGVVRILKG
jgi:hypothetical protein